MKPGGREVVKVVVFYDSGDFRKNSNGNYCFIRVRTSDQDDIDHQHTISQKAVAFPQPMRTAQKTERGGAEICSDLNNGLKGDLRCIDARIAVGRTRYPRGERTNHHY